MFNNVKNREVEGNGFRDTFEIIPPGKYPLVITEIGEITPTVSGKLKGCNFKFQVADNSAHAGKSFQQWFNLEEIEQDAGSKKAADIGYAQCAEIFAALGHIGGGLPAGSLDKFFGRKFEGKVKIEDSKQINETTGNPYQNNRLAGVSKFEQQSAAAKNEPLPFTPPAAGKQNGRV